MSEKNGLNSADKLVFPDKFPVMIRSNEYPKCLLRMSGESHPVFSEIGFGTVNCQIDQHSAKNNPLELFNAIRNKDGTVSFESQAFEKNYLRMAGDKSPKFNFEGFGKVNCQASIGTLEKFNVAVISDTAQGVLCSIESNAYPSNYLRIAGETSPVFNFNGFGKVNCQASVGSLERLHLGAVIEQSVDTLKNWFPEHKPTKAEVEELVASIITGKPQNAKNLQPESNLSKLLQLSNEETQAIDTVDLDTISPCTKSVAIFCVDAILLALQVASIYITRTDKMVKAAVGALDNNATQLRKIITAYKNASTLPRRGTLLFQFISQAFNVGFIKGIIKTIVSGFSWFGSIVAAVSFIATLLAWFSTGGVLFIAQVILVTTAIAALTNDAIAVVNDCEHTGSV